MALRAVFDDREIDAGLAAVCGAYCGACPVYRAWVEQDLGRLEALARSLGMPVERLLCTGCRSPAGYCFGGDCEIKECARARGIAFCPDCEDYPCDRIQRALEGAPYRAAIRRGAARLREIGWYAWLQEEDRRWRCPACGAKVGAGYEACRACGRPLGEL